MRESNRWRWAVRCALIVVLAAVSGQINAYLTDREQAVNQLVIGGNRIEVVEEFDPPDALVPGSTVTKTVRVRNSGHSECYVRIKAVFSDSDTGQFCSLDWNTANYVYRQEDGFYYYTGKVSPDGLTEYLFTTVSVSPEAPPEKLGRLSILVYAESCQSAGFAGYEEAWEYYRRNQP